MDGRNMLVSLKLGKSPEARFSGEARSVLIALAMVLLGILGVAYLATTSPACIARDPSTTKIGLGVVGAAGVAVTVIRRLRR